MTQTDSQTDQNWSPADELNEAKNLMELLDHPDGRKKIKEALVKRWEAMEKAETESD